MNFKSMLLALVVGLTTVFSVHADEKRHRQLAEEYLVQAGYEKQLDTSLDGTVDYIIKTNPDYKDYRAALKRAYKRFFSWEKLKPFLVAEYIKHFSEEDLVELVKFIKTPVGKKYTEKMPELTKSYYELIPKLMSGGGEELNKAIQEEIEKDK